MIATLLQIRASSTYIFSFNGEIFLLKLGSLIDTLSTTGIKKLVNPSNLLVVFVLPLYYSNIPFASN